MVAPSELRQTHTFVVMNLSKLAYDEIATNMRKAGYDHAFMEEDGITVIDMHGLAVASEEFEDEAIGSTKTQEVE